MISTVYQHLSCKSRATWKGHEPITTITEPQKYQYNKKKGGTQEINSAKNNQGISPIHDDPTSHHRQKAEAEVVITRHHVQSCT